MSHIRQISRLSGFAARQFAILFLTLGLGMPVICIAIFAVFGLAASPLIGPSAWEPANDFIGGLALSVTAMPAALGIAVLLIMAIALPATACFGRWCLAQRAARPVDLRLLPLLRRPLWHLVAALTRYLRVPAGISPNPGGVRLANPTGRYSPQPTPASTPAGLSGASPLLE